MPRRPPTRSPISKTHPQPHHDQHPHRDGLDGPRRAAVQPRRDQRAAAARRRRGGRPGASRSPASRSRTSTRPSDLVESMGRQMKAERDKRARFSRPKASAGRDPASRGRRSSRRSSRPRAARSRLPRRRGARARGRSRSQGDARWCPRPSPRATCRRSTTSSRRNTGRVRVADSVWLVTGPDLASGARVRVTDFQGAVLVVEPA
jgi:hypothetical protein